MASFADAGGPFFPFYYERWLKDTRALTLEQRGAYLGLIIAQIASADGALDGDESALCAAARCPPARFEEVVRPLLAPPYFRQHGDGWSNARARWCWRLKNGRREHARIAANRRWEKEKAAEASAPGNAPSICEEGRGKREEGRTMVVVREAVDGSTTIETPPSSAPLARRDGPEETDQQAVVTVWIEVMGEGSLGTATRNKAGKTVHRGGMAPPRIAQAILPLIAAHGRKHVLHNWRRYLTGRDRRFATPEDFASKYLAWARAHRIEPAHTHAERVDEHVAAAMARGVDMDRALDEVFPRKKPREVKP